MTSPDLKERSDLDMNYNAYLADKNDGVFDNKSGSVCALYREGMRVGMRDTVYTLLNDYPGSGFIAHPHAELDKITEFAPVEEFMRESADVPRRVSR